MSRPDAGAAFANCAGRALARRLRFGATAKAGLGLPYGRCLGAALLLCLLAVPALADILDFASFDLRRGAAAETYELDVSLPGARVPEDPVTLPAQCRLLSSDGENVAGEARLTILFSCPGGLRPDDQIGAPWGSDGGVFRSSLGRGEPLSMMLHGGADGVRMPVGQVEPRQRALPEVAGEYTRQGIFHILEGLDHLAFVLCLCLLTRGSTLLLLVTAFTVGHSISLALAYLGVIHVPVPPTEATIALSIAFMAREALLARRNPVADPRRARWRYALVVVCFGLLHGLGFASVLGDLGISAAERIAGLVFFNVGVEIGQLLFVSAVMVLLWLLRRVRLEAAASTAALLAVGVLGCYWTVERVASFLA